MFLFWLIDLAQLDIVHNIQPYLTHGVGAPIPVPSFFKDVPGPRK